MKSVLTFNGKLPEMAENWACFYHEANEVQFYLIAPTVLYSYVFTLSFFPTLSFLPFSLFLLLSSVNEANGHSPGYHSNQQIRVDTSVCVSCSEDSPYDTDTLSHTRLRLIHDWIAEDNSKC